MEARKRSAMTPLLYLEVTLWALLLSFTSGCCCCDFPTGLPR